MTEQEIQIAKQKHNTVFHLIVEDKEALLRKPTRKDLQHATAVSNGDAFAFNEAILNDCWISGDEEIKTNDDYFLAASGLLDKIIQIKQAEIKKL